MSRPFNPERLDELVRRVVDVLPEGVGSLEREARSTLRSVIGAALERMDLVRPRGIRRAAGGARAHARPSSRAWSAQ